MRPTQPLLFAAALALFAPCATQAQTTDTIQPIVKVGEMAGDVRIPTNFRFLVEGFNDNGQILIMAMGPNFQPRWLFQYSGGTLIPIVVGGRAAPGGTWPSNVE